MRVAVVVVQRQIGQQMQQPGPREGDDPVARQPEPQGQRSTPEGHGIIDREDRLPGIREIELVEDDADRDALDEDGVRREKVEREIRQQRARQRRGVDARRAGPGKGRGAENQMGRCIDVFSPGVQQAPRRADGKNIMPFPAKDKSQRRVYPRLCR